MSKRKSNATVSMSLAAKLIVLAVITFVLGVSLLFSRPIERLLSRLIPAKETPPAVVIGDGTLAIHFVDVGQGDCVLIALPDGKTAIVDGGENKKTVAQTILDYIPTAFGNDFVCFDYCILTHTDEDHCGSLDNVLNRYPARTVYRPNVVYRPKNGTADTAFVDPAIALTDDPDVPANEKFWATDKSGGELSGFSAVDAEIRTKETAAYRDFLDAAYTPDTPLPDGEAPRVIVSDGRRNDRPASKPLDETDIVAKTDGGETLYSILFYGPLSDKYDDWNNYSDILVLSYNGTQIMLTGDAEKEAEAEFCRAYGDLTFDVDVFKLGHHGSQTSSSEALLRLVLRPDDPSAARRTYKGVYTIVSCGVDNDYGHPHEVTMERLTALGIPDSHVLRTDEDGTIRMTVDAEGLHVNGEIAAVAPTPTENESPLRWWHIALALEGVAILVLFVGIRGKKIETRG